MILPGADQLGTMMYIRLGILVIAVNCGYDEVGYESEYQEDDGTSEEGAHIR